MASSSTPVAHSIPGRLRLRYPPRWLAGHATAVERALTGVPGVRAVSARGVSGSVVVEYDPSRTGDRALLAALADMARGAPAATARPDATGARRTAGRPFPLSFAVATGALAAAWLPLPGPVVAALVLASGGPLVERAARRFARDGRVGVDALDGLTLILLVLRGNHRAAGLLVWLLSLGQVVLDSTVVRLRRSLREILAPPAETVRRRGDAGVKRVAIDALHPGDAVVVGAGERVPADGVVVAGEAIVDQQRVTGEALPVERVAGQSVFAFTVVEDGEVTVRIERVGADTTVGRIIAAIEAAEGEKAELQLFAEELADRLVLRTLGLAGVATAVTRRLESGIAILVADYGTPVRVAIPAVAMAARLRAFREGILLKGPGVLERLARVDTVVFDKTGTLTRGALRVTRVATYGGAREDDVVGLAAAAEVGFRHPVARAVARLAEERRLAVPAPVVTDLRAGFGVGVRVGDRRVLVGSRRFMEAHGVALDAAAGDEADGHTVGASTTFVTVDGRLAGVLLLQDELRPEARDAVLALRARRMRNVIMVSGDHAEPTRVIAESLGVRHYNADLLPAEKAELIQRLKREARVVAMVGDGVNDALALRAADVGIAVPGGTEVVAEAASVVLWRGGLDQVVRALDLAHETMARFRSVVSVSVQANLVVLGLASAGLAGPATSIVLSNGAALGAALYALAPPGRVNVNEK
jgi:Cu2+-exporting ATPase